MATVAIWKIKNNLSKVIKYVTNKEKVDLNLDGDIKTLVSTINCNLKNPETDMQKTKEKFSKKEGILAFHAYQSFKEGEVTPYDAHEIGMELAKEMWGDRFQVIVATHLNTNHYHNHFIINSVSYIDGKKYYDNRETYSELRRINDSICQEHNVSFVNERKTKKGMRYVAYQNVYTKNSNYYQTVKVDIDKAITQSNSFAGFLYLLKTWGYQVTNRSGKLSVKPVSYYKNIRIERVYGKEYSIENIKIKINDYSQTKKKIYYRKKTTFLNLLINNQNNSFYRLYLHYYYNFCNKRNNLKVGHYDPREIIKMEELSYHVIFLIQREISDEKELFNYLERKKKELLKLKTKNNQKGTTFVVSNELANCSELVQNLISEIKTCEQIIERRKKIENQIEKERSINEYVK